MGAATSLTRDKFIMRIIHDEISRPLDGADVDTPRGDTAKHEVHRLRGLIGSRALGEEAAVELKLAFDEYDVSKKIPCTWNTELKLKLNSPISHKNQHRPMDRAKSAWKSWPALLKSWASQERRVKCKPW